MEIPSGTASRPHRLTCPFCESGELISLGQGFARCGSCGMPFVGSMLETLRDVVGLPDALGSHPCECGHPEMRRLPDGVYHCPACGLEILPAKTTSVPRECTADRLPHGPQERDLGRIPMRHYGSTERKGS